MLSKALANRIGGSVDDGMSLWWFRHSKKFLERLLFFPIDQPWRVRILQNTRRNRCSGRIRRMYLRGVRRLRGYGLFGLKPRLPIESSFEPAAGSRHGLGGLRT